MNLIAEPLFRRWIPAQEVMDRWGMEYISFRQLHPPLYGHIQTKPYNYMLCNCLSKYREGKRFHIKGLEKVSNLFTKEDFELVIYDFFLIAQFEYHHPEVVKNREISPDLEKDFAVHHPAGNLEQTLPPKQAPLTPCQEDKIACQEIAKSVWDKYPTLDIFHLKKHPEILKIVGKQYKGRNTLRNWLKEIAPDRAKQPGRRGAETKDQQEKICKKIGIKI